jgi:hypothetical protein
MRERGRGRVLFVSSVVGRLVRSGDPGAQAITPQRAAAEIADAAEREQLPRRVPIGGAARALLAARRAAPDDVPFVPGQDRRWPGRGRGRPRPGHRGPAADWAGHARLVALV